MGQLFVHHGVLGDGLYKLLFLFLVGKFPVEQQVAGFQVIGVLRQLLDGIAAVQQNTFAAINVSDLGFTGRCRNKARVVGKHAFAGQATYVNDVGANGPGVDGQFNGLIDSVDV